MRTSFGRTGLEWEHLIDRFLQTSLAVVQKSTLSGIVNGSLYNLVYHINVTVSTLDLPSTSGQLRPPH